jgi:uncharacterized protein (DUF4415 family)
MAKPTRQRPTRADRDNPEWSHEDFRRASPAADVLPGLVGEQAAGELLKPKRGRPPADNPRRLARRSDRKVASYRPRLADPHGRALGDWASHIKQ